MSLAYGTLVAAPGGARRIEDIRHGDKVFASDGEDGWRPSTVAFSDGTPGGGGEWTMVRVVLADGDVVATMDHPFLMADGAIRRAERLASGDRLRAADGSQAVVYMVSLDRFRGGAHAVATDAPWKPGSLAGRLLQTGGVVTGDFILEQMSNSLQGSVLETEPEA
ncbi:Hint domain-containing protein [Caulobacter mirabilis]|uniref:Hint domain-containing protein n=1 Tax=Caulobacter mirabilis TaxID=69666 RepID=A0A2D2ATE7_9CAUL|nr:Hint domain-containing protein [Caulobacter mirabilis]ATQ41284.1 hypothetical protein CSW64_02085 [Caulobacter mirabilis]